MDMDIARVDLSRLKNNRPIAIGSTCDTVYPVHRVVVDTNVIVSGLRSRRGASFWLLSNIGRGRFDTVVSVPVMFEYEAVLTNLREQLGLSDADVGVILDRLCQVSAHQDVYFLWRPVLRDPKDECVLEAAVAAGCDTIVTHNLRHFRSKWRFAIDVLTPADFARRVAEEES